jgi:hypothetical protein
VVHPYHARREGSPVKREEEEEVARSFRGALVALGGMIGLHSRRLVIGGAVFYILC